MTLPVRPERRGRIHPISQTIDEMVAIFGEMGFAVAEGPDIEDDWHNFTALNIPPEHPARQMQDTFYLPRATPDGTPLVLRTHTSPVQVRTMLAQKPPIRIIVPGRTYRADYDATHSPMFHQVEGLVIDRENAHGPPQGLPDRFLPRLLRASTTCRCASGPATSRSPSRRPRSTSAARAKGGELKIGDGDDWLEILGCGMVHPKVLANCGIDPARVAGLRLRHGDRADRDAEVRHPRPAHVLRLRPALAAPLRLRAARRAVADGGLAR